jgi:thioredoxin reductase
VARGITNVEATWKFAEVLLLADRDLVEVTEERETSVPGVYAAGDAASKFHQIVVAAASGTEAAIMINRALSMEDFAAGKRASIS